MNIGLYNNSHDTMFCIISKSYVTKCRPTYLLNQSWIKCCWHHKEYCLFRGGQACNRRINIYISWRWSKKKRYSSIFLIFAVYTFWRKGVIANSVRITLCVFILSKTKYILVAGVYQIKTNTSNIYNFIILLDLTWLKISRKYRRYNIGYLHTIYIIGGT